MVLLRISIIPFHFPERSLNPRFFPGTGGFSGERMRQFPETKHFFRNLKNFSVFSLISVDSAIYMSYTGGVRSRISRFAWKENTFKKENRR